MPTFKVGPDFQSVVIAQHGVVVMRGDEEIEFFPEEKAAGSWIQHVYGMRPWDASKQGICIKKISDRGPRAGDAVTYKGGGRCDYLLNPEYPSQPKRESRLGILDHTYGQESFGITFSASAFRDGRFLSCSGGPIPSTQADHLTFIGLRQTRFWRWHDGFAGAGKGGDYYINVPHWLWDGN
jgi:hypothetical protein